MFIGQKLKLPEPEVTNERKRYLTLRMSRILNNVCPCMEKVSWKFTSVITIYNMNVLHVSIYNLHS